MVEPEATCRRISGAASLSLATTKVLVRPYRSRATTTTWRLPDCASENRRSARSSLRLAGRRTWRTLARQTGARPERGSGSGRLLIGGNAETPGVAIIGVTNALNLVALATIINGKSNVYGGICPDRRGKAVKSEDEWADDVKRLLRAEMTRRGVTYDDLAEKLAEIGVIDSSVNIRNKVARGRF